MCQLLKKNHIEMIYWIASSFIVNKNDNKQEILFVL